MENEVIDFDWELYKSGGYSALLKNDIVYVSKIEQEITDKQIDSGYILEAVYKGLTESIIYPYFNIHGEPEDTYSYYSTDKLKLTPFVIRSVKFIVDEPEFEI